jgi:alpha-amylase/alpha-mannosidase (GH57 family)
VAPPAPPGLRLAPRSTRPHFESRGADFFRDPWAARNDYISIILDRSTRNLEQFFQRHSRHPVSEEDWIPAIRLLELQRHTMLMYTSCGWFFDELSGIETAQVIQYAGRAPNWPMISSASTSNRPSWSVWREPAATSPNIAMAAASTKNSSGRHRRS